MVHIYYGLGKGKTSALNGAALRARGAGLRVLVVRFLKGQHSAEDQALEQVGIIVRHFHYGNKFVIQMNDNEKHATQKVVEKGLAYIREVAKEYNVIALDELLDLAADNVALISEAELITLINNITKKHEVIISGHVFLPHLFAKADLITEMVKHKHYFDQGQKARKGIEY